ITCAEACAGACSGTYILKELSEHLGFSTCTTSISEPDPVKRAWISRNFASRIGHHFKYVSEQRTGGYCLQHKQDCVCPVEEKRSWTLCDGYDNDGLLLQCWRK
ncbi:unnamed protein product, partial [Durusdinium trenchii]